MDCDKSKSSATYESDGLPYFSSQIWASSARIVLFFSLIYIAILISVIFFKIITDINWGFDINTPALLISLGISKKLHSMRQGRLIRVDEFVISFLISAGVAVVVQLVPVFLYFDVRSIPFRSLIGVVLIVCAHVLIVLLVLFPWRRLFTGCLFEKR